MKFKPTNHILEGYASYKQRQEVPINNRINLIFGPNNGGKSTLLKSILYAEGFYNRNTRSIDPKTIQTQSESIDLGKMRDLLNTRQEEGVLRCGQEGNIEFSINNMEPELKECLGIKDERNDFLVKGKFKWSIGLSGNSTLSVNEAKLCFHDLKIFPKKNTEKDKTYKNINQDTVDQPVKTILSEQRSNCILKHKKHPTYNYKKLVFSEFDYSFFLVFSLLTGRNKNAHKIDEKNWNKLIAEFEKNILHSDEYLVITDNLQLYQYDLISYQSGREQALFSVIINLKNPKLELDLSVLQIFESLDYSPKVNYVPPLRNVPKNIIMDDDSKSEYSVLFGKQTGEKIIKGEPNKTFPAFTNDRLVPIDEIEVLNDVLKFLEIDYRFKVDELTSKLSPDLTQNSLVLQNIHTGRISGISKLGTGLSQLLPIIITLFQTGNNPYGKNDYVTIVEQPELHLHPGLQTKFGPLCSKYIKENRRGSVYFETHSEHIIKSIQLEVAKFSASDGSEGLSKDDITILYVSSNNGESHIKEIKLDDSGSFTEPWPDDFFELSADLTMERLRNSFRARN